MSLATKSVESILLRHEIVRVVLCLVVLGASAQAQAPLDPVQFYAQSVKPLLASRCYSCHTMSAMGGLRLDSPEALAKGGKSGPAVAPGAAANSLLFQVVAHTHSRIKMPPGGRLTDAEIDVIRKWVESGAHFDASAAPTAARAKADAKFWSFQRPVKAPVPKTSNSTWVRTPIDAFILATLEAKGLRPAPQADKRTLLRRVTLDLTGLPPTPEEYKDFLRNDAPDAFEKVVDRLLASPQYGERWGRHWLDVARYVDVDGISVAPEPFANAWRYRDWVIKAVNDDMPYDQFVRAQIAGDLLDKPGEHKLTPAVGFLALGPWYYKIVEPPKARADELQDRIDVIARGMLGVTVACARCHDHKYDPIPTRDYYGIGGVLASTEYREVPLADASVVKAYDDHEKRIADLQKEIKELLDRERASFGERMGKLSGKYLLAVWGQTHDAADLAAGLDAKILGHWAAYLQRTPDHSLLGFWPGLMAKGARADAIAAAGKFQAAVDELMREHREITEYNERVIEASKKSTDPYDIFCKGCRAETRALPRDKYLLYGDLFEAKRKTEGESREAGVFYFEDKEFHDYLKPEVKQKVDALTAELESAKKALPQKYPFLHILGDVKEPGDMPLHRRGDPYNLGEMVPRHFLSVMGKPAPAPLSTGSGRVDLANQIASGDNPLTARVIVNRLWHGHFGAGIVRSTSNLGAAGDRPSHPELLDYLAVSFVENGWSLKKLHREIVLSSAYATSSEPSPEALAADPENRLLSHFNRNRLDVEALRDSMLAVSGELDLTASGPPVNWDKDFRRRTLYGEVSRFRTERLLTLFDFPNPSIHAEKRIPTNTSVQRLFFLNSDFTRARSAALAARVRAAAGPDAAAQLRTMYQMMYGRDPEAREREAASAWLRENKQDDGLAAFAQVLFSSNEFSFVD